MNNNLETDIERLKERNARVELDKSWETSWTRRIFISIITYVVAIIWLYLIKENGVYFKAVVPTVGYLLSTMTIPQLKKFWINSRKTQ